MYKKPGTGKSFKDKRRSSVSDNIWKTLNNTVGKTSKFNTHGSVHRSMNQ